MENKDNWERSETQLLINLYKECPCLYDTRHPHNQNKNKRAEKLNYILNKLKTIKENITINIIKKKIYFLPK